MSELRKRTSNTPPLMEEAPTKTNVAQAPQNPTITRNFVILLSLASSVALWLCQSGPVAVTSSYAVCSRAGAKIYTVDDNNPAVQCLVVHDAFIVDTGSLEEISARWNAKNYSRFTLPVRYIGDESIVVPGLSDSHAHILEYGASRQFSLEGGKSIKETVALVRDYITANPDIYSDTSKFIEGWGWDHTSWPVEEWPTADALDADPVIRGRPVVLQSKDGHALWTSKKALDLSAPFPQVAVEGGVILRDAIGNPTGVLLDNAQGLVKTPALTEDDLRRRFALTVRDALSFGLTSIHDAGFSPVSLEFFKRQAAEGSLPIRIYGMQYFNEDGPYWGNISKPIINAGNGRLNARSVKIFADGALRSGGAALYEPYHDNPGTKGFMRLDETVLREVVHRYSNDGWQVNVHAIGDYANRIVLDAFEAALGNANVSALRPRLEHAQILSKEDIARVGKLGVIASVQAAHAVSDMWYAEDRLGPERVKGLYAFRSLLDHGARLAFGSDFPVEGMNPLSGFYAAVTRLDPNGASPKGPSGWFPEQRLTRQEALRGMTIDAAYASFTEDALGSITPGKRADFVVLSQDIMRVTVDQILKTKVQATIIDGEPVYGSI
ncbi:amidohydrolase family-domain-containing protein [Melanogaster broomeanus]|nr:amidohydrolase family-domain-containing protein [Melanogaster broomeanus]